MKRHEQDELLKELLTGEEVSELRRATLASGLGAMRRRRRQRQVMRAGAMLLAPLLLAGALIYQRKQEAVVRQMAAVKPAVSPEKTEPAGVKSITDEELFALFPGRAMALVGTPGEQQLVFLDGGSARAMAR